MKAMMMALLLVASAAVVATPTASACSGNSLDDIQACSEDVVNLVQETVGTVLRVVCEFADEGEDCE